MRTLADNAHAGDGVALTTAMSEAMFFSYACGNADMHLKNFSFFVSPEGRISFAPLYDVGNSSVYDMSSFALVFPHSDGWDRRPDLDGEDGAFAVCDFLLTYLSASRMMEILDAFGNPFRSMMRRMPFSDSFAQKLAQNIEKRTGNIRRAIENVALSLKPE